MRRFHAFLLSAGLLAAPTSAAAQPTDSPPQTSSRSSWFEQIEWSASKGRLGVLVQGISPELRAHFGSTDKTGVLVGRVEPGSPAARAGIAVGDVIVEVRDTKIDDAGDVLSALATADKRAQVKVLRDKQLMTFDVELDTSKTSALDMFPGLRWLRELFEVPQRHASST